MLKTLLFLLQGDCSIVKRRVCNGQTHKVRSDGTRITCKDGKFTAVKGRKGRAEEEEDSESENNIFIIIHYLYCNT